MVDIQNGSARMLGNMDKPTKEEYVKEAEARIASFIRGMNGEPLDGWASTAVHAELDQMFDVGFEKGRESMVNE